MAEFTTFNVFAHHFERDVEKNATAFNKSAFVLDAYASADLAKDSLAIAQSVMMAGAADSSNDPAAGQKAFGTAATALNEWPSAYDRALNQIARERAACR